MAETTILVRLEGHDEPLPLADLSWEHVAPCGCACGVAEAEHYGADHDAVIRALVPNAESRRREEAEGFTYRLVERAAAIERMRAPRCAHVPIWGVERAPTPEGHRWAHASGGRRSHLVPIPSEADPYRFGQRAVPICGGKSDWWSRNWDDHPTCRTCEKRARELASSSRLLDGDRPT